MASTASPTLYAYPWDLAGQAPQAVAARMDSLGIGSVTLAMSYHAGKFMRPWASGARVVFPEDGVLYFEPAPALYGRVKPLGHADPALRSLAGELAPHVPLRAWLVLLHNSRIGALDGELVVRNAWGDPYVYSLCPSHPANREYALAVCRDAACQPVAELVLETPGWLPYAHGYHHEFAQVRSNLWLETLTGLCFCGACTARARQDGIDATALAGWVRTRVDAYLDAGVDADPDQAASWLAADLLAVPELAALIAMRQDVVTELVGGIRAAVDPRQKIWVIPTVQRPTAASWVEGAALAALARAADGIEVPFYEPTAARVAADAWDVLARVGDASRVRAILRPGPPDLAGGAELAPALARLATLGLGRDKIGFYNYGLLRRDRLEHMARTLQSSPQGST
jgi:hypothetical protein